MHRKEQIKKLCQEVKNVISSSLKENNFESDKKDEFDFLQGIKKKLENINENFKNEIKELEESSDWDNFCISFFGETNAGKSTIIDTLRIIYNEESRLQSIMENQKEVNEFFNQNNEYYSKLVESVGQMKTFIKDLEQNKATFETEKDAFYKEKQQKEAEFEQYREDYEKLKAFIKDLEQNKATFETEKDTFYKEKQQKEAEFEQYRENYEKLKAFYKIKRFSAKALVISALSSGFITAGIYTVIQYFI